MSDYPELTETLKDHEIAFTETAFLLEILVATVEDLMGRASSTVGVNAGRHMGRKLPIDVTDKDLGKVLEALSQRFGAGFEMTIRAEAERSEIDYGRCAVREVCKNRGLKPGGELCKIYHQYLAGIVTEVLDQPMRARIVSAGDTCQTELEFR